MTGTDAPRYVLRTFGATELAAADGEPVQRVMRQPKRLALLAYLACARPLGLHRRDKLAALLWPELNADRARGALRTALSRLRDDLGDSTIVVRGHEEVGLAPAALWCDTVALDDALRAGDLEAAWTLYRGPFCEALHAHGASEEFESWMTGERRRYHEALQAALVGAATDALRDREADRAVSLARRALQLAPTDEPAARALIEAHSRRGDRAAALATLDALRSALQREYGVEPSRDTLVLAQALRAAEGAAPLYPEPDVPRQPSHAHALPPEPSASVAAPQDLAPPSRATARGWGRTRLAAAALVVTTLTALFAQRPAPADAGDRRWTRTGLATGRREARHHPMVLLDSTRNALLVVGGMLRPEPLLIADDALRFQAPEVGDVATWTSEHVRGIGATARWLVAVANDIEHDVAIGFGGASGTTLPCHDDVWVLRDLSGRSGQPQWTRVETPGTRPSPRADAQAFYDPTRRALVVFGGHDCVQRYHTDAWILQFDDSTLRRGTWRRVAVGADSPAPTPRTNVVTQYDRAHARLFVFGGRVNGRVTDELWALTDLYAASAQWTRLHCADAPAPRAHAASVWDDRTSSMLIVGGLDDAEHERADTWQLQVPAEAAACRWLPVDDARDELTPRFASAARFDPRARRVFLYGGYVGGAPAIDVWTLDDPFRSP